MNFLLLSLLLARLQFNITDSTTVSQKHNANDDIFFQIPIPRTAFLVHSANDLIMSVNVQTRTDKKHFGFIGDQSRSFGIFFGNATGSINVHCKNDTVFSFSVLFIPSECDIVHISSSPHDVFHVSAHGGNETLVPNKTVCFWHSAQGTVETALDLQNTANLSDDFALGYESPKKKFYADTENPNGTSCHPSEPECKFPIKPSKKPTPSPEPTASPKPTKTIPHVPKPTSSPKPSETPKETKMPSKTKEPPDNTEPIAPTLTTTTAQDETTTTTTAQDETTTTTTTQDETTDDHETKPTRPPRPTRPNKPSHPIWPSHPIFPTHPPTKPPKTDHDGDLEKETDDTVEDSPQTSDDDIFSTEKIPPIEETPTPIKTDIATPIPKTQKPKKTPKPTNPNGKDDDNDDDEDEDENNNNNNKNNNDNNVIFYDFNDINNENNEKQNYHLKHFQQFNGKGERGDQNQNQNQDKDQNQNQDKDQNQNQDKDQNQDQNQDKDQNQNQDKDQNQNQNQDKDQNQNQDQDQDKDKDKDDKDKDDKDKDDKDKDDKDKDDKDKDDKDKDKDDKDKDKDDGSAEEEDQIIVEEQNGILIKKIKSTHHGNSFTSFHVGNNIIDEQLSLTVDIANPTDFLYPFSYHTVIRQSSSPQFLVDEVFFPLIPPNNGSEDLPPMPDFDDERNNGEDDIVGNNGSANFGTQVVAFVLLAICFICTVVIIVCIVFICTKRRQREMRRKQIDQIEKEKEEFESGVKSVPHIPQATNYFPKRALLRHHQGCQLDNESEKSEETESTDSSVELP